MELSGFEKLSLEDKEENKEKALALIKKIDKNSNMRLKGELYEPMNVVLEALPGRNKKCPCNSLKAYKRCCEATDLQFRRDVRKKLVDMNEVKEKPK